MFTVELNQRLDQRVRQFKKSHGHFYGWLQKGPDVSERPEKKLGKQDMAT
jgi:hypothetical protein